VFPATPITQIPTNDPRDLHSNYSLAKFDLSISDWKAYKSILLRKTPTEKPELLALPDPDASSSAAKPLTVTFHPAVGTDEADFTGDGLATVKNVTFSGKALTKALSGDKKTLIVRGLIAAGATQSPSPKELSFEFDDGHKATVLVDIVNLRVETNQMSADKMTPK
jgi:hypothetical protein